MTKSADERSADDDRAHVWSADARNARKIAFYFDFSSALRGARRLSSAVASSTFSGMHAGPLPPTPCHAKQLHVQPKTQRQPTPT
jgi:hypothetical protein